jgi:nucleosome binding factor SPN SPT16 subunit
MSMNSQDFSREVLRIDAIPTKKLDTIKEWLTSVKIKYYESKMNLAWKPILKHILEDPKAFIEEVRHLLCVICVNIYTKCAMT